MNLVKCTSNNNKYQLTEGKIYEVEAELFDLDTFETYAIELYDDGGNFIQVPVDCVESIN